MPHGIQQNLHFQRPIWLEMGAKILSTQLIQAKGNNYIVT